MRMIFNTAVITSSRLTQLLARALVVVRARTVTLHVQHCGCFSFVNCFYIMSNNYPYITRF